MRAENDARNSQRASRLRSALAFLMLSCFAVVLLAQQAEDSLTGSVRSQLVPILTDLVERSREDAINRGAEHIPAAIRQELAEFVPAETLDEVLWRIDGESVFFGRGLFAVSSAYAVTLDKLILFADAETASDASVWAHEIKHVMQFDEWGIEGFLTRYLTNADAVEREAKEFQYQWWKATRWQAGAASD